MSRKLDENKFTFAPFFLLFLPCAAIAYLCEKSDVWSTGLAAVLGITGISLFLFVVRNWADLLAGILGSLVLIAILAGCALIPVIGWIADVLIVLFALVSVVASIGALVPYALKAAAIWAVFLIALAPGVFHPIGSPLAIFVVSLGLGAALGKKARPFDEFLLIMSSVPLLAMAIASLGRLFQSNFVMKSAQFQQHVSGYTTRTGVQVGDYTRTITKTVAVSTTSVNPGAAAAIGAAAASTRKDDAEA